MKSTALKKILAIFLAVAMFTCLGTVTAFAVEEDTLGVTMSDVTAKPGDIIVINVDLTGVPAGWGVFEGTLHYDTDQLWYDSTEVDDMANNYFALGSWLKARPKYSALVTYAEQTSKFAMISTPSVTGAGEMMTFALTVKEDAVGGTTEVWFEDLLAQTEGGDIIPIELTKRTTVTIDVPVVDVTDVTVTPETLALTAGETGQLAAAVAPENATNKDVTWSTNVNGIINVDETGKVTAIGAGSAVVTATSVSNPTVTDTCLVTVAAAPVSVTGVTVAPETATIAAGATQALTATVAPENADNKAVLWASDNLAAATVDDTGVVTGVAGGTATITATTVDGSFTDTCIVTVTDVIPVTAVTVTPETLALNIGETGALSATVLPEDATDKALTWSSSDEDIATVDANGVVTAVGEGSATITAASVSAPAVTDTCVVTVTDPVVHVDSVTLNKEKILLQNQGETQTLVATVLPENATDKTVTWDSSNDDVATVDANGVVTPHVAGTAIISATSNDNPLIFDTCEVTVESTEVDTTITIVNCNEWVNVRSGPSSVLYGVLGRADKGAIFELLAEEPVNGYYMIDYNGQAGYVYQDYAQINQPGPTPVIVGDGTVVNCNSWVNVRSGPSSALYSILGRANKDAVYDVYDLEPINGYYMIDYNGTVGYIHQNYFTINEEPISAVGIIVNCKEWVNVRSGPSSSLYPVIGQAEKDGRFLVLDIVPVNGYYKIDYNKNVGYVHQDYIQLEIEVSYIGTIVNTFATNIYADASTTSAVKDIAFAGDVYEVLYPESIDGFITIACEDGTTGYVLEDYIDITEIAPFFS